MSRTRIAPWLSSSLWPTVAIRRVARLGTGHTPSRSIPEYWDDCSIPWITLADVWQLRNGSIDTISDTKEKISLLGLINSAAVKHPAGTVILSRTASVGFSAIMGQAMATSQDFATWTCGERLHPRYLLYALRATAPDLKRLASGSTHKTVYMPDIEDLRVPLPPLKEQRRIVDFLDGETSRIDQMATLKHRLLKNLDEHNQAVIDQELDRLFAKYGTTSFRRMIRRVEQGVSPLCDNTPASPDEWGVLKVSAIKKGRFVASENKRLPGSVTPDKRHEVREDDLLITRANTPALVGAAAVAKECPRHLLLCDKIFRLDLAAGIDKEFVVLASQGTRIRDLCRATSHGTSQSMANLKIDEIKSWPIPAADLIQQRESVKRVSRAADTSNELRASVARQLDLLAERRQTLITAAVTGQLDVTTVRSGVR